MVARHELSGDHLTWRFTLRDGLLFHDGEPVRAVDCVTSINRWAKRRPLGQKLLELTEEMKALDDRRFEIRLRRPFGLMLDALGKALDNPAKLPPVNMVEEIREPIIRANILTPEAYIGNIIKLCEEKRGVQIGIQYLASQVQISYELPMAEVVLDFFDKLKSVSRGYASLDYHFLRFEAGPFVRVDTLINGDRVDALSPAMQARLSAMLPVRPTMRGSKLAR